MKAYDYLIIGGGIAGTTAAETLHTKDSSASIAILEDEPHLLYSRVLIPEYLKGRIPRDRLYLRSVSDYEKKHIDFFPLARVVNVDILRKEVFIEDERIFPYRKLLIASGGRPKALSDNLKAIKEAVLPQELGETPELFRMQTMEDADMIKEFAGKSSTDKGKRNALVLGEGFIALEFLETFSINGFEVHALARSNFFAEEKFGEDGAGILEENFKKNHVIVHKNANISFAKGRSFALTNNETVEADCFGVGIGLERNLEAFQGLQKNIGIVTNEFLETSDESIFAAGDVAEFYDVIAGRQRLVGNWTNSFLQGRRAALNMLGQKEAYKAVSTYNIINFGLNLTFMGDIERADETVERNYEDEKAYIRIFLRENIVRGAALINKFRNASTLLKLIGEGGKKNELDKIF